MSTPAELMTPSSTPSALLVRVEPPITSSSFVDEGQETLSTNVDTSTNHRNPYSSRRDKAGDRPMWSSRCAYTCGALLSVPLSQLWRGGALLGGSTSVYASLIGLTLSICVIGLPLYVLELGWGQKYQVGALGIWQLPHFGKRKRRWTGLGVCGMLLGLVYSCYTMGILAWTLHALLDTFTLPKGPENPWFASTNSTQQQWGDPLTGRLHAVELYWIDDVVGQYTLAPYDWQPTQLILENVANSALLWAIVGTTASFGIRHLGRISLVTTTASLLLLITLFGASLSVSHKDDNNNNNDSVSGSSAWEDFAVSLNQDDVLSESIVQTVYITGILVGIQTAYASYGPAGADGEPIGKIACLVMALSVLLIFTTGYVLSSALPNDTPPFYHNIIWNTGLRLVFAHWPSALSTLPGGIAWVRLLYSTLLLIGIQLPLAVVTAILAILKDDRASTAARYAPLLFQAGGLGLFPDLHFLAVFHFVGGNGLFSLVPWGSPDP
jgi:SNF family Na+-dependent transporter